MLYVLLVRKRKRKSWHPVSVTVNVKELQSYLQFWRKRGAETQLRMVDVFYPSLDFRRPRAFAFKIKNTVCKRGKS